MIIEEIYKNNEITKYNSLNEKEEEKIIRLSNIAFTQLLSYTNNMMEFKINKSLIIIIIDEFVKQYKINENYSESIYGLVCEKNEIESLREKGKILVEEIEKNNNEKKENIILNNNNDDNDRKNADINNNNQNNINNNNVKDINNNEKENNNKINEENNINNPDENNKQIDNINNNNFEEKKDNNNNEEK